tara:strand:- start:393 stop:683 length:291 start_codon:yes stop_codon:yes gene_type:complete
MSFYWILDAKVHDTQEYERYKKEAPKFVEKHGGEYCCRGGKVDIIAGNWNPERIVMIKFPSKQSYENFISDPDYKPWKKLRESLTTINAMITIEGV